MSTGPTASRSNRKKHPRFLMTPSYRPTCKQRWHSSRAATRTSDRGRAALQRRLLCRPRRASDGERNSSDTACRCCTPNVCIHLGDRHVSGCTTSSSPLRVCSTSACEQTRWSALVSHLGIVVIMTAICNDWDWRTSYGTHMLPASNGRSDTVSP